MKHWLLIVVSLLAVAMLVAACGSEETTTTSTVSTAGSESTTTAAGVAPITSDTAVPTTLATIDDLEAYKAEMKEWHDKHQKHLEEAVEALDGIESPLDASEEDIEAIKELADVMDDAVDDLDDIEPPAELSSLHSDYLATLRDMALGADQLAQALKDKSLSGVMDALTTMGDAVDKGTPSRDALEEALGFSLSGDEDDTDTTGAGELGSRRNPIPLGQEAQVGDWTVKVLGATLDATQAILDENQFNDPPEAGYQYVLVNLEATYDGTESATFWVEMSYTFVGSGGNTYESGMAVAPDPITDEGEVFPGASVSGNLVFAVASDQVSGGTLSLEQAFSFEETRVFFALE